MRTGRFSAWLLVLLPLLCAAESAPNAARRIVIVGDSTASEYPQSRFPRTGWAQVLDQFLAPRSIVLNRAVSGRSTRSYVDLGHFASTAAELRRGDLLLIQFGHNDAKRDDSTRFTDPHEAFPAGLQRFIDLTRERKATPVLITPVARRSFDAEGRAIDTHGEYAQVVRDLAIAQDVALVDLSQRSMDWIEALGPQASLAYYPHDAALGLADDTHFHRLGALAVACMIVGDLLSLRLLTADGMSRDADCGVPANHRQRLAEQRRPSMLARRTHSRTETRQKAGQGPCQWSVLLARLRP